MLTSYSTVKDIVTDIDEVPDEEIHRVRSGRVPSAGASVPIEVCHPPRIQMCLPTRKISKTRTFGIFTEASSNRYDESLTQSLALLPFQEDWGEPERYSLYSRLDLSDNQPPPESHQKCPH